MVQSPSWEANWFAASQEIPFYGTWRFITAFTSFRHPSLSWASQIQSTCPQPTSWKSILILSTHLCLGLPSGLFPSGFPTRTLYAPSPPPYALHAQPISFLSILSPAQYWVRSTDHLAPRYAISSINIPLETTFYEVRLRIFKVYFRYRFHRLSALVHQISTEK